ncbi:hypothetical protein DSO57_1023866 [Entomophthora muscae]|uniref:Uncharacterized protein n=1 Tax=Entomophthora muscae TaxID=34485 RepID=A0ACC2RTV1_9FUNG|nr:hypothetical protein DSO57_1023866 [Entomophthora muscae]
MKLAPFLLSLCFSKRLYNSYGANLLHRICLADCDAQDMADAKEKCLETCHEVYDKLQGKCSAGQKVFLDNVRMCRKHYDRGHSRNFTHHETQMMTVCKDECSGSTIASCPQRCEWYLEVEINQYRAARKRNSLSNRAGEGTEAA